MAAPSYVQHDAVLHDTTATVVMSLTGVTAGNLLVVCGVNDTDTRIWGTITDDQSNTWTIHENSYDGDNDHAVLIASTVAGSSGDIDVTIDLSENDFQGGVLIEVTPATYDTSDLFENSGGTTWYSAASGEIDTSNDVILFMVGQGSGNLGTITDPSGYTRLMQSSNDSLVCYMESDSALTDHRASWSGTIERDVVSAVVAFKAAGGGGPDPQPAIMFGCAL